MSDSKVYRNLSTKEGRAFWAMIERVAATMPCWLHREIAGGRMGEPMTYLAARKAEAPR